MISVSPNGEWPFELPPHLVISGGRGTTPNETEVHISIRRGTTHEVLGWYSLDDLLIAIHTAGAVLAPRSESRTLRLTEPADEWVQS